MKNSKIILYKFIFFFFAALLFSKASIAQDAEPDDVKNWVESRSFIFKPQSVTPLGGRNRIITTEYDMWVSKDSLKAYLPYFGRAYIAPIGQTSIGIMFTSTEFDYTVQEKKKGSWNVLIKPKDTDDVRQLFLNIGANGMATLHVTSTNRQAISFNGYIKSR